MQTSGHSIGTSIRDKGPSRQVVEFPPPPHGRSGHVSRGMRQTNTDPRRITRSIQLSRTSVLVVCRHRKAVYGAQSPVGAALSFQFSGDWRGGNGNPEGTLARA